MSRRKRASPARFRVGKVSVYQHHSSWWLYFRERGKPIRRKAANSVQEAEQIASQPEWLVSGLLTPVS